MQHRPTHPLLIPGILFAGCSGLCSAQEVATAAEVVTEAAAAAPEVSVEMFTTNNLWMMVATFLVFIMHLGFASLEAGMTRAKNTVNILFKNTAIIAVGILTYTLCGFNLMYPGEFNGLFGFAGWGIDPGADYSGIAYAGGAYTYWTDFLFQAMFAATAATIVSGAVAERMKLGAFLIFSTLYVAIVYPIAGSWKWGGGFLADMGFHDFAGSTLVHSVGGWAALVGVFFLGPRIGKYVNGRIKPIMGHNLPLATIGVFLLWLGWFGFNGGSVLSADADGVSYVLVTTCLAAAAGIAGAIITSWVVQKKPDLTMALNGSLAGLVGITAGSDVVSINSALIIGLVAGIIVVASVIGLDKAKIDDPVGAVSVHLVCGMWGTLAVGLFAAGTVVGEGADAYTITLGAQLAGIASYAAISLVGAGVIFGILKATIGIRVSEEEEVGGLDIGEHGQEAYSGFQIWTSQ